MSYTDIYTLTAIILKIFEPNFIMLFLGLIARLSSLVSKIDPRGWSGEGVEILKKLYISPYGVYRETLSAYTDDYGVVRVRVRVGVEIRNF